MQCAGDFDKYAAQVTADADPGIVFVAEQIDATFPDAQIVIIERDFNDAEAALNGIFGGANFGAIKTAYIAARALWRDKAIFIPFEDLSDSEKVVDLIQRLGGTISVEVVERMQSLKITATVIPPKGEPKPLPVVDLGGNFDFSGCSARPYRQADFPMLAGWWKGHGSGELNELFLPPLGVVVERDGVPVSAAFCCESYGVPVAEIVYPCTAPGLSRQSAGTSLAYAFSALVSVAGKGFTPPASFSAFKAMVPVAASAFMRRIGFKDAEKERHAMTLTI